MRAFLRPLLLISAVLLIPVLPFLAFGPALESALTNRLSQWSSPWLVTAGIVVVLATDVFLPVPSSFVSTLGGAQLGWVGGTTAAWLGMTAGALLGFALARRWGHPLAVWLSGEQTLSRTEVLAERLGPALLVLTRAVPILAEASVLLLGVQRLSWSRFLPAVLISNLGIALAYAVFGDVAAKHQWLPLALAISLALPLLLAMAVKRWLPK